MLVLPCKFPHLQQIVSDEYKPHSPFLGTVSSFGFVPSLFQCIMISPSENAILQEEARQAALLAVTRVT